MADYSQSQGSHDEEALGKAYDARLMRRLLAYLKPYRFHVVFALLTIMLRSGVGVLGPYLTKVAIDRYLAQRPGGSHSFLDSFLSSQPLTGIAQIGALYLAMFGLGSLLDFVQTYLTQWTGQKVMFDLRSQIYRHLQQMHMAFFDHNPTGRLVTRVTTDVDALNEMFAVGVVSMCADIFVLAGIVAIMLGMNWQLALVAFAVLPLIYIATTIFRKDVRGSYRRIRVAIARMNSHLQEHVTGILPVQLLNREEKAFAEFKAINTEHMLAFTDAIMADSIYDPVVQILSTTGIACVLWYGGQRMTSGALTLGVLVAFVQYAQRFFRPIEDLSEKYGILQSAMASSERIFQLLDSNPEVASKADAKLPSGSGQIEFDHVWFAYGRIPPEERKQPGAEPRCGRPGDWDWVLRDVSFTVKPGETTAVVGHTGAGKTTLISLLLRFYDVQQGTIRLDGIDIRDLDVQALRLSFGVVLQDPFLFSGTIESNIRLGSEDIDPAVVERAAGEVNLSEFIHSLPEGFRSRTKERGSTLSTGQKQLISFARALARNPRILILDEATSSVDTETEFRVRETLKQMPEGRTSLIVAHRLSTVQRADHIIVLHKGTVREMGTHQQLLAQRGIYHKLYRLQYRDQEIIPAISSSKAAASRGLQGER